jgi:outer membrane protein TolC
MRRVLLLFLAVFWASFALGCANMFRVDLTEQRERNLEADVPFARAPKLSLPEGPLSLAEAVRIGMENNLDLRIARLMEEISSETALAEKLRMLPRFDARADWSERNNFPVNEFQNIRTGEVALSNTISRERNQKTLEARLTWNVLDFGLSYFRARQAAIQEEISRLERTRQAQTLAREIAAAYWRSVLAEKNLEFVQRMGEELGRYKTAADEMVSERRLDPIFAKDIERQLASLAIEASDIQSMVSGIRIDLCRLMGVHPSSEFDLAGVRMPLDRAESLPAPEALDPGRLEEIALRNRLELYASDLREEVQRDEARAALVSLFPGLRLEAGYNYDDNKFLINSDWFSAGAGLAYDVLSLPSRYADWRARLKGVDRAMVDRLVTTAGILAQVHIALHDYQVRERQFRLRDEAYDVYRDLLDMSRARNEAGVQGFPDTVVTQRMMESVVARLERGRALVDFIDAHHILMTTLGLEFGRWDDGLETVDETAMPPAVQPPPESASDGFFSFPLLDWFRPGDESPGQTEKAR